MKTDNLEISKPILSGRLGWIIAIGGWSLFGGIIGTATYARILQMNPDVPWWPPFLNSTLSLQIWACVMPLIFRLGRRFRMDTSGFVRSFFIHLGLSVIVATLTSYYHVFVGSLLYAYLNNETIVQAYTNFGMPSFIFYRVPWQMMLYWMILWGGYAADYYRMSRERQLRSIRLQSELSDARLSALKQQLQPHFLFNALHSVNSLIQQNRSDAAINMITHLSDLLRSSISDSIGHEVSLSEEIELLNKYVDTEKIRFSDRLTVTVQVMPETREALVPHFLLQPLVENAIKHGIEKRSGAGLVTVNSYLDDKNLMIEISDNWQGFNGDLTVDSKGYRGNGVGLAATRGRLKALYAERGVLTLKRGTQRGTVVRLSIPFHTTPILGENESETEHEL